MDVVNPKPLAGSCDTMHDAAPFSGAFRPCFVRGTIMLRAFRKNALLVVLAVLLQSIVLSSASVALAVSEGDQAALAAQGEGNGEDKTHAADSRGGKIATWMFNKGISADFVVMAIAAMPIVELRGAVPVAHHVFDMGLVRSFVLSVIGNMIPVPAILLLLGPVSNVMRKIPIFDKFFTWLFNRTRRRSGTIQKYQELGLILFIAVPLPVTGAWTGSLAAFLFGLRFWLSMFCVVAGVCIAGVVVSTFSAFGWMGAAAAGMILSVLAAVSVLGRKGKEPEPAADAKD